MYISPSLTLSLSLYIYISISLSLYTYINKYIYIDIDTHTYTYTHNMVVVISNGIITMPTLMLLLVHLTCFPSRKRQPHTNPVNVASSITYCGSDPHSVRANPQQGLEEPKMTASFCYFSFFRYYT